MKLISEHFSDDVEYITEQDDNGKKKFALKGIFMQPEIKNRNGRVYPIEVKNKEEDLDKVSHMVTSLKPDGKNFIGEAKVMSTPMGEIVKNIMDDGGKLAVSSRGMGSLTKKNGANYVNDDFYLATAADIVADPSAPNAFVQGIMEGKEWVWNNGMILEQDVAEIKDEMERNVRSRQANYQALAFAKFLKKM